MRARAWGIVGVGLSINYFQNLLESYETEFGVQIYLVNHDGVIEISSSHTGYEDAVDLFALKGYGENVRERVLSWREDGEAYKQWTSGAQSGKTDSMWFRAICRNSTGISW